ncbi:ABC transporter permease [Mangrovihabitans endophyticus]|nr:FtsX-like permease family protein [Mangrovihabitans endophyticus]
MTIIAIALGAAALVASWVVSESISHTLVSVDTRTDVGVSVQSLHQDAALTPADRDRLAALPGVRRATGVILGRAGVVSPDGKLASAATSMDLAGTNADDTGRMVTVAGRAPSAAGEVAINADVARRNDLAVGMPVRVLVADGRSEAATVVGTFDYRTLGSPSTTDWGSDTVPTVAFDAQSAPGLLGDRFSRIELATAPGTDLKRLRDAAERVVGGVSYRISTGPELARDARERATSDIWDLRFTLLPFAVLAMLVGMTVISNTFTILVTQRIRQFALLRAVGASRRQVRRTVLAEAVVLGLAGGTVGVLLGVALGPGVIAITRPADDIDYTVPPLAVLLGYLAGVLITVVAAYGSARRASAVSPMAALRSDATVPRDIRTRNVLLGVGALLVSAALVFATRNPNAGTASRIVAIGGAVLGGLGVLLLTPTIAGAVLGTVMRLMRQGGRPALRFGVRNAARDPRRTASTASAITVGLALICAFASLSASLSTLIGSTTRATVPTTTTVLQPGGGNAATLDPADLTTARHLPGVSAAAASRDMLVDVDYPGGTTKRRASAIEPEALNGLLTPHITGGSGDLRKGFVIAQNQADMLGLGVGDPVTLQITPQTSVRSRVAGVYEATELQSSIYFDVSLAPTSLRESVSVIYLTGPDPAAVRARAEAAFRDRPDVTVTDQQGLVAQGVEAQRLAFVVMYAMFAVALIIALFGVVNTLALSVSERGREIGMARAVGASRSLIRRSIRVESLVISLLGALLGVLVGVAVGTVMQHAMLGQRLSAVTIPLDLIGAGLAAIVLAAMLAAAWPARRAASTAALSAIAE